MSHAQELLVFDYNGTARSGKGTIVSYLCETFPEIVTSEETGKDYRAITKALLEAGSLSTDMSTTDVTKTINSQTQASLYDMVEGRSRIIASYGEDSLYDEPVNNLVAGAGQSTLARLAVKAGLKHRVEAIVSQGNFSVLLLDGRNLSPVLDNMPGVKLRLKTFVTCTANEATRRECLRKGLDPASPEAERIERALAKRTREDAERKEDAARPEADALDYWHPPASHNLSVAQLAVRDQKQIVFDTTPLGKPAMLEAAQKMFTEALNFD